MHTCHAYLKSQQDAGPAEAHGVEASHEFGDLGIVSSLKIAHWWQVS